MDYFKKGTKVCFCDVKKFKLFDSTGSIKIKYSCQWITITRKCRFVTDCIVSNKVKRGE